jgi:hypothetical protein
LRRIKRGKDGHGNSAIGAAMFMVLPIRVKPVGPESLGTNFFYFFLPLFGFSPPFLPIAWTTSNPLMLQGKIHFSPNCLRSSRRP